MASKHGIPGDAEKPSGKRPKRGSGGQSKTPDFPVLVPFDIPDEIDDVAPEAILDHCGNSMSEDIYQQDLLYIFKTPAQAARLDEAEMHKQWLKCRMPSVGELWSSRYPEHGSYQTSSPNNSLRMLLTIEALLARASNVKVIERLQRLHLDYIMYMCLIYNSMDRPNHYFPCHQEQFMSLLDTIEVDDNGVETADLGRRVTNVEDPSQGDTRMPARSKFVVPEAKRAAFEALRILAGNARTMEDISGYEEAKAPIKSAVFIPTRAAHLTALGIGSKGILLYGPPGTGKSMLAESTASLNKKCAVFRASSSDLIVKWMGESEQNIACLFAIAGENSPSIIIIDEIESLCQNRQSSTASDGNARRVATTLLNKMDEHQGVCVVGTTNVPWQLDPAFARRFRRQIHVGLPSHGARLGMIKHRLQPFNHGLSEGDIAKFASECDGFTGSSIIACIEVVVETLASELELATHFKSVIVDGKELFCPCGPHDGGFAHTYEAFEEEGKATSTTTAPLTLTLLRQAAVGYRAQVRKSRQDEEATLKWADEQFFGDSVPSI